MGRTVLVRALVVLSVVASTLTAQPAAAATTGGFAQLNLAAGCREAADSTACAEAAPLQGPVAAVVSANGQQVYVAAHTSQSVLILNRNVTTGALSERATGSRCVGTAPGCTAMYVASTPRALALSPTGSHLYVASNRTIQVFAVGAGGGLSQLVGPAG